MEFYKNYAAFNISWHEIPKKEISSYIAPKGILTRPGMDNFIGCHAAEYSKYLSEIEI